jgi:hypothetical protein
MVRHLHGRLADLVSGLFLGLILGGILAPILEDSGQRACRQHEAKRCAGLRPTTVAKTRAVQTMPGGCRDCRLGYPLVGGDPGDDGRRVSARGKYRRALDHLATREVRTR